MSVGSVGTGRVVRHCLLISLPMVRSIHVHPVRTGHRGHHHCTTKARIRSVTHCQLSRITINPVHCTAYSTAISASGSDGAARRGGTGYATLPRTHHVSMHILPFPLFTFTAFAVYPFPWPFDYSSILGESGFISSDICSTTSRKLFASTLLSTHSDTSWRAYYILSSFTVNFLATNVLFRSFPHSLILSPFPSLSPSDFSSFPWNEQNLPTLSFEFTHTLALSTIFGFFSRAARHLR